MTLVEIPEVHSRQTLNTLRSFWVDAGEVMAINEAVYRPGALDQPRLDEPIELLVGSRIRLRDGYELVSNQPPAVVADIVNKALEEQRNIRASSGALNNRHEFSQVTNVAGVPTVIFQGSEVGRVV